MSSRPGWSRAAKFLSSQRDLVKKVVAANAELTDWMQKNPDEAQKLLIDELTAETKTTFAPDAVRAGMETN